MTTQTVSETLNKAADLIEQRGWAAGVGWEDCLSGRPLCVEGAIAAAMGMDDALMEGGRHCPAHKAVRDYLQITPFIWNDNLAHDRVNAAIDRGETLNGRFEAVRAEAREWAKNKVVEVLRAAAVIEAAKENSDARQPVSA